MFQTSADFLNISLGIGFIVLVIFISMVCFYLVIILRDISKVVDDATEVVSKVKTSVVEPLKAFDFLVDKISPYVEKINEQRSKGKQKKKKN